MAIIGQPLNRVDGPRKVAGTATYAYEHWNLGQPVYGHIVGATIGYGRIAEIDTSAAERSPGVRMVLTHRNAPEQGDPDPAVPSEYSRANPTLKGPKIRHFGEPVALVLAETLEQAMAAANLVTVEYHRDDGRYDILANEHLAYAPKSARSGIPADTALGDIDEAFASAPVKVDVRYTTPYEFAQPLEMHNCLAVWNGDDLTAYVSTQLVNEARTTIAATFRIPESRIRLISSYVGGGFGSKLATHYETILAIMAARELRQPVKVSLTRDQVFQMVGLRAATIQRVRLGASQDGRLVALGHDVNMYTARHWEFTEQTAATTRSLYASPNRLTRHRLTPLDLQRGEDVRAPGDAPGLIVVESAMDELAHALDMDPVELRVLNEPPVDPERNVPFSDRHLVECMREGARRFGWKDRPIKPVSRREGRFLVGYGMAAAIRMHFQGPSKASVRLGDDGIAVVRLDMTDIGTGTYTILTQVAADALDLPVDRVRVELGDSNFPPGSGSGGSWGAGNSSVAVHRACLALREKLPRSGEIPAGGVEAEGEVVAMEKEPNYEAFSIFTYGAHFVEVGVDADCGEVRLRRMLGVFSAGRILNVKTARSQLIGGMTWGVSAALHEDGVVDPRSGAFANRDLAQYLVPVHADIPAIEAIMLEGRDDKANVLGVKGLGELGVCGAGAAVANAVFNATGVRVREFPITIEKLLPHLPALEGLASPRGKGERGRRPSAPTRRSGSRTRPRQEG